MSALLGLALLLQVPSAPAPGIQQPQRAPRPQLVAEPARVELGEPFTCRLDVAHGPDQRASLPDGLALDASWLLLEDRGARTLPDPLDPARATTSFLWELCSLEPGERELEGPFVAIDVGGAGSADGRVVKAGALVLQVRPVLYPEEDAPRALKGLPPISLAASGGFPWGWGALAVLVTAGLAVWWRSRRRRTLAPVAAPLASARLAALAEAPLDSPEDVERAHVQAASLVRAQVDAALGAARPGLTDEEWLAAVAPGLARLGAGDEVSEGLARLARTCGEVKYAHARPTHWAARETLELARGLARRVEACGSGVPGASEPRGPAQDGERAA